MAGRVKTTVGVVAAIAMAVSAAAAAGDAVIAAPPPPTVAECAQLQLKSPKLRGSRIAATVFCLRPASIRTTASLTWTTCPTTPIAEPCSEGVVSVSFKSAGKGANPDSWGGEDFPGAGLFSLPGTGTYRCKASDIDRQVGRIVLRSYTKTLPLRDQAVGFAAVGNAIKVATSIHPGFRGPFGQNANVRLGQPDTCELSGLAVGGDAVRATWPGGTFTAASLGSVSTRVTSSGNITRSFPVNPGEGLSPGVKIRHTVRWSSTVVVVPAL
jgi:hypothetical protein